MTSPTSKVGALDISRRKPTATDIVIEILYCGVCHSDLHYARNEWADAMPATYPAVPGHEIVGRVVEAGSGATKFKVGDLAAVGCMVDSCRTCTNCKRDLEQFCENGCTMTYGSTDPHLNIPTHGGYSEAIVVDQAFALKVPTNLELPAVAPLLCAGITTYSPLRHWKAGPGKKVGIVGLGGLGHMGVKFSHAMGAHTVVFTTSPEKKADALRLGADEVVMSKNPDEMAKHANSFDFILNAVAAKHDINAYFAMLKLDGTLAMVGAPSEPLPVAVFNLIMPRRQFAGSAIGGIAETQEMLDFCSKHNITSDIELIKIQYINEAWDRMEKGDVKYRFVIDMASIKS
ncbi:MAG: NAD(P)-dependent alcohol dehydrogenase [Phycisphaerales bacterium]|nr:NAD(P)-dependent alcohol dehydrogenase [Phycisphaerales bacterium]MCB9857998.1 NAD(P)-dependent alcohol dehydrogenase [Phycisphaerales bacterium]